MFVVTGAGMSMTELTLFPGSSKVVEGITIPYGEKAFQHNTYRNIQEANFSRVSPEVTKGYYIKAHDGYGDSPIVVVNGALITNRYRRGVHQAYFIVDENLYHVVLPKETEEDWNDLNSYGLIETVRFEQDRTIARLVLSIVQGNIPEPSEDFKHLGSVR